MERAQALNELRARISNGNLIKHCIAVEAIMKELAIEFKEDIDKWGLVGLLHDIDCDLTANDSTKHGIIAADILESLGVDESIIYSIKAHNSQNGIIRKRKMDKALYAADPLSGLITASALILPSKKLSDVSLDFLLKRFNEKGFAKGADRDQIKSCEEIGLSLEKFIEIGLNAMKNIAGELEL